MRWIRTTCSVVHFLCNNETSKLCCDRKLKVLCSLYKHFALLRTMKQPISAQRHHLFQLDIATLVQSLCNTTKWTNETLRINIQHHIKRILMESNAGKTAFIPSSTEWMPKNKRKIPMFSITVNWVKLAHIKMVRHFHWSTKTMKWYIFNGNSIWIYVCVCVWDSTYLHRQTHKMTLFNFIEKQKIVKYHWTNITSE